VSSWSAEVRALSSSEHVVAPDRPHQGGWGEPASRAQLWRIADDLRRRAGFGICAIEVRRSDDMMEFVAIATDDPAAREVEGRSSPLDAMYPAVDLGDRVGVFTFVPWESMTEEAWERIEPYVVVPEGTVPGSPDAWHPQDMLLARLVDASGRLRAFVYFDVPHSRRRPSIDDLVALGEGLDVSLQSVITTIEREEYAAGIRLATGARTVVRSAASRHGLGELLRLASEELHRAFRAAMLAVDVFGEAVVTHPPGAVELAGPSLHAALRDSARACWRGQRLLLVDGTRAWGDDELDAAHRDELMALLARHGWGQLVVVPVGAGDEVLGMLGIARAAGSAPWTDDESSAALDVGHDLGRAILNARASQREREAAEELRRVDDYRAGLIATLAHELKNPIGVVAGHAEVLASLADDEALPAQARTSLDAITRGADRLATLVDDLMTLSKVGDPSRELEAAPVDLRWIVTSVAEQTRLAADRRGVEVVVTTPPDPLVVLGEETSLTSVVVNLLTNAIGYSDAGDRVRLAVWRQGDHVVLECADEGLGISPEDQEQLFTEFFRSTNRAALDRPGTGLGLTITRRVVERHQGRIEVDSELGVGSTFRVLLPAAAAPSEAIVISW
jgi:two-component system, OmpR family, phosphate regulon sensor histidine kinase PhoR